jgi:hypothetical protein
MPKTTTTVSLRKFTIAQIRSEMYRRKKVLAKLAQKRKRLLDRINRLNLKIQRIGGK